MPALVKNTRVPKVPLIPFAFGFGFIGKSILWSLLLLVITYVICGVIWYIWYIWLVTVIDKQSMVKAKLEKADAKEDELKIRVAELNLEHTTRYWAIASSIISMVVPLMASIVVAHNYQNKVCAATHFTRGVDLEAAS